MGSCQDAHLPCWQGSTTELSQATARRISILDSAHLKGHWRGMLPACHSFWMTVPVRTASWLKELRSSSLLGPAIGWELLEGCASPSSSYPCLDTPTLILPSSSGFGVLLSIPSHQLVVVSWLQHAQTKLFSNMFPALLGLVSTAFQSWRIIYVWRWTAGRMDLFPTISKYSLEIRIFFPIYTSCHLSIWYLIMGKKSKERKGFYGKVKRQWGRIRRLMIKEEIPKLSELVGLGLEWSKEGQ